jgi:hypothetical protein
MLLVLTEYLTILSVTQPLGSNDLLIMNNDFKNAAGGSRGLA